VPDLRTLLDETVTRRVIPAPPVDVVRRRAEHIRTRTSTRRRVGATVAASLLVAAVSVSWARRDDPAVRLTARPVPSEASIPSARPTTTAGTPDDDSAPTPPRGGGTPPAKVAKPDPVPTAGTPAPLLCKRSANGGATDVGVTENRIRLGMTNTRSGTSSSLVGDAHVAVQAVVDRVNRNGGICGRLLEMRIVDDPSGPSRWPRFDFTFAELVGPLQPGFDAHIANGTVDRAKVPAVGTDGLTTLQFSSPWVWPVGTPTSSLARIAVHHAYGSLGARTFALVYEEHEHWRSAEVAVREYVATLPGASLRAVQGVTPNSMHDRARDLDRACGDAGCDVILLALSPEATGSWLQAADSRGRLQTAVVRFMPGRYPSNTCPSVSPFPPSDPCPLDVWSGYTPPVGAFLQDPDVARYHQEVTEFQEGIDDVNPLIEGTYVGMQALVEALQRVGPNLTRDRLREVLAKMRFESGLVGEVDRQRGGNVTARLLRIGDTVEDAGTGWVRDPHAPGN
jgi:ABC-type branched-subunit amino acid transport system substrate-binding protein